MYYKKAKKFRFGNFPTFPDQAIEAMYSAGQRDIFRHREP